MPPTVTESDPRTSIRNVPFEKGPPAPPNGRPLKTYSQKSPVDHVGRSMSARAPGAAEIVNRAIATIKLRARIPFRMAHTVRKHRRPVEKGFWPESRAQRPRLYPDIGASGPPWPTS